MRLSMLSAVLKELQDPDWRFISGVKLGVDVELPRTLAVFEEKVRWNLDDPDDRMANVSEDCRDPREHVGGEEAGWMVEMSDKEAQEACWEKLYIASLAVVTEKDKIRLVRDATNKVQVNNRTRQALPPGAGEMRTLLREWQERRAKMFAVIGDASKAHRRIKVKSLPTATGPGIPEHRGDLRIGFIWKLLGTTGQWRGCASLFPPREQ